MIPNFDKDASGLLPAIVQDHVTKNVLMLGYMNKEAYEKTLSTNKVTFFSRSKNRLWTKGEESGNFLNLIAISIDCDNDTFLVKVDPQGQHATQAQIPVGLNLIFKILDLFQN